MITLNDSQLFTILRKILIDGFAAGGFTDKLEVTQKYQPELGGMPLVPTIYMYKLTGSNYGFSSTKAKLNIDDFTGITSQMKTPMFQVSALVQVNPEEENPLFPTDYVEFAAAIMNMPSTIAKLKLSGIGVERVREIREGYFLDDKDLYEQTPSFDFTISYQKEYLSKIQKVDHIEGEFSIIPSTYSQRYFRYNKSSLSGYDAGLRLIPDPKVHFDIEFQLIGKIGNSGTLFSQNTDGSNLTAEFIIDITSTAFVVRICGGNTIIYAKPSAGLWRIRKSGGSIILTRNGVPMGVKGAKIGTSTESGSTFLMCLKHDGSIESYSSMYSGIMANVVLLDDKGRKTDIFLISSNGNVIPNAIPERSPCLIVNGEPDEWGLFVREGNNWRGQDLVVPPWLSDDQLLIVDAV